MNKNENSFYSLPTSHNSNLGINNIPKLKNINEKKSLKTVTFNDTVVIYSVESYKELNKKLCYNEEEGLAEFYKEFPSEYNARIYGKYYNNNNNNYNKYFGGFRNPNVTRRNVDPECCCNIM